ncbi:MAG: hypothetical protein E7648_08285 [Ruminococcaceae bacterium]|nr:hypothetical protein [Oscillospiraceae bacterium]
MNKRIKVLVSAVLATVMLVLCIPFTAAAADPTSATFDFTSLEGKGSDLSGSATLATLINGCESTGSNYITAATATKVYNGNGTGGKWATTAGFLKFGTGSVNGVLTLTLSKNVNKVEIVCYAWNDGASDTIKVNSGTAVTAPNSGTWGTKTFEIDATNEITITTGKRGFVQSITVYFDNSGAAPSCTHTYDDCEDTTCNKCSEPRTAPGHAYTNEYDASCNNDGCTNTRTVTLPAANSTLDLVTASKIGAAQDHNTYTANKYYVTGTVKTVGSDKYGNITIEDEDGNTFYLYTVKDNDGNLYEDVTENKPVVGAEATFYGPLGRYNSTTQMNPAVIYVKVTNCEHEYTNELDATCDKCGEPRTVTLPAADSTLDFATITKLGLAQGHNNYTSAKYYFVGTIKEVSNPQFGNMTVEDEDGNVFTVYGSYNATGDKSYSEMTDPFVAGDKVKVYGIVGQYNGTAQIKNGWLSAYTAGSGTQGGGNQGAGSPNTGDNVAAYIAVAVVALFGIAYVSKKKH